MSKFKTILCPVDFSQASDHALHYARDLAKRLDAKLELVHVLESVDYLFTDSSGYVAPEFAQDLEKRAKDRLGQLAEAIGGLDLVRSVHVVQGTPYEAIRKAVDTTKADLVVMGTHGRTGLKHMLLGSVAEKVVRVSPVPVLTVPRDVPVKGV